MRLLNISAPPSRSTRTVRTSFIAIILLGSANWPVNAEPQRATAANIAVAGTDADGDGVRDDIGQFIAASFDGNQQLQRLASNLALSMRYGLLATSKQESIDVHSLMIRSQECLQAIRSTAMPYRTTFLQVEKNGP